MHALNLRTGQLKVYGAILASVALIAAALELTLTSGAQAQNADNTYDDPQPCGPGAQTAFQPEPHEITSGHFALFDAYWERTEPDPAETLDQDDEPENTGILHTNTCPPLVTQTREFNEETEDEETVTTLVASGIDIDEAIFHVLDDRKVTVAEGGPDDANSRHLRLDQYPEVENYANVGDQVWWLRLDDPDLSGDQTSDLTLGFSTMRFSDLNWALRDGAEPFRYKFELERHPGIDPEDHPHFLAYKAREQGLPGARLVWDSADPDDDEYDVLMHPGQLEDLQWVFTTPGTYVLSVHLKGYVRQADNPHDDAPEGWKPISGNHTVSETSEVKQYVIQVGSDFTEVEPPSFGVSFTVDQRPVAGDPIGDPIRVFGAEVDSLQYSLSGEGAHHFALVPLSYPDRVQIVVADGVTLNPTQRKHYRLTLGVTDGVDHENNEDLRLDHTLAVEIELTYPWLVLTVENHMPLVNETVVVTAHVANLGDPNNLVFHWSNNVGTEYDTGGGQLSLFSSVPSTLHISAYVTHLPEGGDPDTDTQRIDAHNTVTITWR